MSASEAADATDRTEDADPGASGDHQATGLHGSRRAVAGVAVNDADWIEHVERFLPLRAHYDPTIHTTIYRQQSTGRIVGTIAHWNGQHFTYKD